MTGLARICFWGYTGMLLGVGAAGVLVAPWELHTVFALPLDAMDTTRRASILNQYRFLKSVEWAFGLFCVLNRAAIFRPTASRNLFLAGVSGGVFARVASLAVDGMPHWAFVAFAALECVTGLLVWRAAA